MLLTDNEVENILKLFYQGLTKSQIANKLGYKKYQIDSAFMSGKGYRGHKSGIRYRSIHRKGFSHKKKSIEGGIEGGIEGIEGVVIGIVI